MKILNRYLRQSVFRSIMLVMLVLISLQLFIDISHEFSDLGFGNYGVFPVIIYTFLLLPQNISLLFPMAGLLGTMIGLGMLASRSELIIMRTSGVSVAKIAWAVIGVAVVVTFLGFAVGEGLGPVSQHEAAVYKANALSKGQALHTSGGTWVRNGTDFIHIGTIRTNKYLSEITRYIFNNNYKLDSVSLAQNAHYKDGKWTFYNINTTNFGVSNVASQHFAKQTWAFKMSPRILNLLNIETNEKSLPQLRTYIRYLKSSGLQSTKYEFTYWQRILQPFATIVMILLAIPFIFGPLRTVTMGYRILIGTVVGFGFFMINEFVGPLSVVYQFPPLLAALLPTVLVGFFAIYLIFRARV